MHSRPLLEDTLEDAKRVFTSRFGSGSKLLDYAMTNPARRLCAEAGDVVYADDGTPIGFQACILRKLYIGKDAYIGKCSGGTSVKIGAPVEAFIELRAAAAKQRAGSVMGFGNSQNQASAKVAKKLKSSIAGPSSCERYLWRAIRPVACGLYFLRRKILKGGMPSWPDFSTLDSAVFEKRYDGIAVRRMVTVEPTFFDVLMRDHLMVNEGAFFSRSAEEIEWIFGDRIRKGTEILLGAFRNESPCGYVILKTDVKARRWEIHDWFAVGNDKIVLERLLQAAIVFLRECVPSMMLEVRGFPSWVQPLLRKYLPHVRNVGHNCFAWGSRNKEFKARLLSLADTPKSWFFGPYDGDECMS